VATIGRSTKTSMLYCSECTIVYSLTCSSHKAVSVIQMTSASVSTITVSSIIWFDVLIMPVNSDNVLSAGNEAGHMHMQQQDQH